MLYHFYYPYTFRQLGEVGQQLGASLLLCRLTTTAKDDHMLHIANTGLCEAILCRDGEVIRLTSPHAANTNKEECQRIIQLGGFITKVYIHHYSIIVCMPCVCFVYIGWNG